MAKPRSRSREEPGSRSYVRSSFQRRFSDYIQRLAASAPEELLADALAAGDENEGLARLLSANVRARPATDPLAAARARARAAKEELLARSGGTVGVQEAADRLGVSRQAVDQRRRRGTLLAVQEPNGRFVYPAFQFEPPELAGQVGDLLGRFQVEGAWSQLSVLLSPSRALGGRTPIEALRAGDRDAAMRTVSSYGEQSGA